MSEPILIAATPADGVLLLKLNVPERRNALATPLLAAVADHLDQAADDEAVRCVVLTGDDKAFAAGADINELADEETAHSSCRPSLWSRIRDFPKPLVAAVNGWCLGAGNELLMCCDLSVASTRARFGQPETNLGILPGAGGTATLARLVGRSQAMRMVLLGEPMSAEDAWRFGLVTELAEPEQTLAKALEMASRIAARAPLALRAAKASVKMASEIPLSDHLQLERSHFIDLLRSADKHEGVTAFLEKREPRWTGR